MKKVIRYQTHDARTCSHCNEQIFPSEILYFIREINGEASIACPDCAAKMLAQKMAMDDGDGIFKFVNEGY